MSERTHHDRHVGTAAAPKETPDYIHDVIRDPSLGVASRSERRELNRTVNQYGLTEFSLESVVADREALSIAAQDYADTDLADLGEDAKAEEVAHHRREWVAQIVDAEVPMPTEGVGKNDRAKAKDLANKQAQAEDKRAKLSRLLTMPEDRFAPVADVWVAHSQVEFQRESRGVNAKQQAREFRERTAELNSKHNGMLTRVESGVNEAGLDRGTLKELMSDPDVGVDKQWERYKTESADEYQAALDALTARQGQRGQSGHRRFTGVPGGAAEAERLLRTRFAGQLVDQHFPDLAAGDPADADRARTLRRTRDDLARMLANPEARADYQTYHDSAEKFHSYVTRREIGRDALRLVRHGGEEHTLGTVEGDVDNNVDALPELTVETAARGMVGRLQEELRRAWADRNRTSRRAEHEATPDTNLRETVGDLRSAFGRLRLARTLAAGQGIGTRARLYVAGAQHVTRAIDDQTRRWNAKLSNAQLPEPVRRYTGIDALGRGMDRVDARLRPVQGWLLGILATGLNSAGERARRGSNARRTTTGNPVNPAP